MGALPRIVAVAQCLVVARSGPSPPTQVERTDNDRQHVVEVMREIAGKLAHPFHLLDMAQLRFDLVASLGFSDEPGIGIRRFPSRAAASRIAAYASRTTSTALKQRTRRVICVKRPRHHSRRDGFPRPAMLGCDT
ncbi:hypothetical protein [Blastomonas sp. CCH13-E1]|uniref:hypothetical protein n=1 Tax=Blastomonas sp. CCH13-E1 TaxID=1768739 RepID=UPI0012E342E7|nr:hypothetical protein [Blastomonas sp. CCH13-E1]